MPAASTLIARGITTKDKLFIIGGSAGGITMGRALTERPDLFAGVIDLVPAGNTLRAEFSPNGPPNIPEFGTVKTEAGFKNLYEMDTIRHVKKGVQYPAVMVTTGLNDPRVSPWEPAKVAAALQASGTARSRCCCASTRRPATESARPRPRPTSSPPTGSPSSSGAPECPSGDRGLRTEPRWRASNILQNDDNTGADSGSLPAPVGSAKYTAQRRHRRAGTLSPQSAVRSTDS